MTRRRARRTPGEWLRDDLRKMNRPSTLVKVLRRHPRILLDALGIAAGCVGVLAVVLTAGGNLAAFGDYVLYAVLPAGLYVGQTVHAQNAADKERSEQLDVTD